MAGGNTKALRVRIKSVSSTLQLTKAMGLVASSKIRRANEAMMRAREYTESLSRSISELLSDRECAKSPYARQNNTGKTKIFVIAGDRGLAGGYNANIFRLCAEYKGAEFIPIGKRACEKNGKPINSSEKYSFDDAYAVATEVCEQFARGEFDRLGIISTKYRSIMTQEADITWILPFERAEREGGAGTVFEPDCMTVLEASVREYVAGMLTAAVRESFACEVTARRMAMDSAGKNAKEMIDKLSLEYNRARQGAITQEITEIVAGSGS